MQRIRFRNGPDGPEIVLDEQFETEDEARSQLARLEEVYGTVPDAAAWLDGTKPPKHLTKADEPEPAAEPPVEFDLSQPIGDLLATVGDDGDLAAAVLAAENDATDNTPRKGLAEGLQKVIDAAAEPPVE